MNFTYDPIADAVGITFKNGKVAETKEISPGILLDVDRNNKPLYLEILDASKKFEKKQTGTLSFEPLSYQLTAK